MRTVAEEIKRQALASQEAAKGKRVYKARLRSGDGWEFVAAATPRDAAEQLGRPVREVCAATHAELITLAVRALQGK